MVWPTFSATRTLLNVHLLRTQQRQTHRRQTTLRLVHLLVRELSPIEDPRIHELPLARAVSGHMISATRISDITTIRDSTVVEDHGEVEESHSEVLEVDSGEGEEEVLASPRLVEGNGRSKVVREDKS